MNAAQLERLQEQCARLRLIKSRERLEALLQEASTQELPYAGYRVFFTTAANMIAVLTRALGEGRLEEKLKHYTVPRLLIIDEIGYLPIDRVGANLFFQLISRRYEKGPLILTSNQSFGAWGE